MKALLIDDDEEMIEELKEILEDFFQCDVTTDCEEGIGLFGQSIQQKDPYSLVCIDLVMPKKDGRSVLQEIRCLEKGKGIDPEESARIMMVTSINSVKMISGSFNTGCDAYIVKPVDRVKIVQRIRELGLVD